MNIGLAALNLLLPPHCAGCDAAVPAQGAFCAACFREASFITEPACARCGVPLASAQQIAGHHPQGPVCARCLAWPPPWDQARAAFAYDALSRRMVLEFKHGDRTEHAAVLASHMARAGARLLARAALIVPVPLHRARLLARRYNQAALLALALSRRSGVRALPDALARTRATAALGQFSAARRTELLAGAIAVRSSRAPAVVGQRVLLVDDVLTSGATAAAATGALLAAGAASVDVLVVARVRHPYLSPAAPEGTADDGDEENA